MTSHRARVEKLESRMQGRDEKSVIYVLIKIPDEDIWTYTDETGVEHTVTKSQYDELCKTYTVITITRMSDKEYQERMKGLYDK